MGQRCCLCQLWRGLPSADQTLLSSPSFLPSHQFNERQRNQGLLCVTLKLLSRAAYFASSCCPSRFQGGIFRELSDICSGLFRYVMSLLYSFAFIVILLFCVILAYCNLNLGGIPRSAQVHSPSRASDFSPPALQNLALEDLGGGAVQSNVDCDLGRCHWRGKRPKLEPLWVVQT